MSTKHTVLMGECLSSISFRYGFFAGTLWHHPDNQALKALRGDPTVLLAGDVVSIPDKEERKEKVATGKRHRFRRKGVPARFKTRLLTGDEPRIGLSYELIVEGVTYRGKTDADGVIEHWISPAAKSATLVLLDGDQKERYELQLGHMDPVTEPSGLEARLRALGFLGGKSESPGGATRAALAAFQRQNGLDATGEINESTRRKLVQLSGG